jgi:hypothetical protein
MLWLVRSSTGPQREQRATHRLRYASFAAEREPELLQHRGQAHGMLRHGPHYLRQAISEGLSHAGGIHATKATDVQNQTYGILPPRKIARAARVVAIDALRRFSTTRATGCGRGRMGGDRQDLVAPSHRRRLAFR